MESITDADLTQLSRSALFEGISQTETRELLGCLRARKMSYTKGNFVVRPGEHMSAVGVVVDGAVFIGTEDFWGNSNLTAYVGKSGVFGEAFACLANQGSTVQVRAAQDCAVVWLEARFMLEVCSAVCGYHQRLVRNVLSSVSRKNMMLARKVECLSQRTTREKVLAYLSSKAQEAASAEFDIPFNRQQLADYLAVERSALSATLSKMQRAGEIRYSKNHFELL